MIEEPLIYALIIGRAKTYDMRIQPWLARLSFTFFIIAVLLVWQARFAITGSGPRFEGWRYAVYLLVAAASFALGILGVRARHRGN
jgi:hypothetical protein